MDNKLLKQLYEQYYREIYLYVFSLCNNTQVSEDLTQETFLKALLSLKDGHTNMRAWLYTVARNSYFNYRKKNAHASSTEEIEETLSDKNAEEQLNKILDEERSIMLQRAMRKLEQRYREVLTLQYFCGMSQRQISLIMKTSPENIRVLAHRARQQLKKELEEMGYDI